MSSRNQPLKSFRWTLHIAVPGTYPPRIEVSTGKSRDRNAAMRAALRGRIQQIKALRSETGTSILKMTMLMPGMIEETLQWRLTPKNVEDLVLQAYTRPASRPSRSTSSAIQASSTGSLLPSTPTTPDE